MLNIKLNVSFVNKKKIVAYLTNLGKQNIVRLRTGIEIREHANLIRLLIKFQHKTFAKQFQFLSYS